MLATMPDIKKTPPCPTEKTAKNEGLNSDF
jgi:hypothetical protein